MRSPSPERAAGWEDVREPSSPQRGSGTGTCSAGVQKATGIFPAANCRGEGCDFLVS